MLMMTEEQRKKLKPYQDMEDRLLKWRFISSIIVCFDFTLKIAYLSSSRFASIELREVYYSVLWIRPTMIICIWFYGLLLHLKQFCVDRIKSHKKFKDDIAYQKEIKSAATRGKEAITTIASLPIFLIKQGVVLTMCWTGFIRLASSYRFHGMHVSFGHSLEIVGYALPCLILQNFNNYYLNSFRTIDYLSNCMTALHMFLLWKDIYYSQMLSKGNDFFIVDRSKLGYEVLE